MVLLLTLLLELSSCEDYAHSARLFVETCVTGKSPVPDGHSGDSATLVQGSCLRRKANVGVSLSSIFISMLFF